MRRNNIVGWIMAGAFALLLGGCSGDLGDGVRLSPDKNAGSDERLYRVGVGGSSEIAATRAEYDAMAAGAIYKWTPGDRAGFYMAPKGTGVPVIENAPLTGTNTAAARFADFEGEITEVEIGAIDAGGEYDYYSYYPYGAAADVGFPNVAFEIPSTMNLTPDVFPVEYGFMVADKVTTGVGQKPITWLYGGQQQFGEHIGFRYRHVFSYLEVYLALNLMSQPVGKIVITSLDGPIAGTANIDLTTGAVSFGAGASGSITVNIGGEGLDIRSATDYGRIWIPINPALSGKQFKLDFYSAVDARNVYSTTVSGKPLQAGMKHKAGFKLPFYVNFYDLADRDSGWSSDGWNNISHDGYDFKRWNVNPGSNFVGRPFDNGHLTFDAGNGVVYTPTIKTVNSLGLSGINVKVSFVSAGNDVLWWPFQNGNKMRYGITAMNSEVFMGEVKMSAGSNIQEHSFTGTLTAEKPHVIFKANLWGAYFAYMEQIKIEYIP